MVAYLKYFLKRVFAYRTLIILLFLIGIFIRILFYSYNRPFWNDECALVLDILGSNYEQAAPLLFKYLSLIMFKIFPVKELGLRLIPLLCSISSIFLFYKLTKKYLISKFSCIVSMFLFVFSYPLVYYAQEFKQYSGDVFCFILILLSYEYLLKIDSLSLKSKILLGIIYSFSIWFSFSSVFALGAIFVCLLFYIIKGKLNIKSLSIIIFTVIVNLCIFYFYSRYMRTSEYLHTYWSDAFINKGFHQFLSLFISNVVYIFSFSVPFFYILVSVILSIFKDNKNQYLYLLSSSFLIVLLLSFFNIYPFSTRVVLFLIPIFILFVSKIFDYIRFNNLILSYITSIGLAVIICIPMSFYTIDKVIYKNYNSEDILKPLDILSDNIKKNDVVIISDGAYILYNYYGKRYNITNTVIVENERYDNDSLYIKHLESYKKGKTYYWVLAHHPNKFARLNSVYNWAKNMPDFRIYADKYGNALIRYHLK